MKISKKKTGELYTAIAEPIMKERVGVNRKNEKFSKEEVDLLLFSLEQKIWKEVKQTLKLED